MSFEGKIALVTGAGTGIGKHASLALLADGYSLVLAGRRLDRLQETIAEAGADGTRAIARVTDVADAQSVAALFAATKERFGRLDVLAPAALAPDAGGGSRLWRSCQMPREARASRKMFRTLL